MTDCCKVDVLVFGHTTCRKAPRKPDTRVLWPAICEPGCAAQHVIPGGIPIIEPPKTGIRRKLARLAARTQP